MKGSLIIVGFFVLGTLCGAFHLIPFDVAQSNISFYALCALMFSVGAKYRKRSTDLEKFPFAESKTDLPACCYYTGNHIGSCTGEPHSSPPECRRLYGSWFGLWLLFTIQHLHYAI